MMQTSTITPTPPIADYFFPLLEPVMFVIAMFLLTLVALTIGHRRNIRSQRYWNVTMVEIAVLGSFGWLFIYDCLYTYTVRYIHGGFIFQEVFLQYCLTFYLLSLAVVLLILGVIETVRSRRWV